MLSARTPASLLALLLLSPLLVAWGWLAGPFAVEPVAAAPALQAQPTPSPRPAASPTPTRPPEQQLLDLQVRKVNEELRLIDAQRDRLRQEEATDKQAWRASADFVAAFGPTLVGLGLLYLLARALAHFLPPAPARSEPADEEEDQEED